MERTLEYDLDFFYNQPRLILGIKLISRESNKKIILNKVKDLANHHRRFLIYTPSETIQNSILEDLTKLVHDIYVTNGVEIYISMSTSTTHNFFLNPILSILHFDCLVRFRENNINYQTDELFKQIPIKNQKGILSIQRENVERNAFIEKFNTEFDGIFRYVGSTNIANNEKIPFYNLINEIRSSYVYFYFETFTTNDINPFTEKTILGFLSYTMPILFLRNESQLAEFENMGFWFLNRELGYTTNTSDRETNINLFLKCIRDYNLLKMEEIINLYKTHFLKIEQNHKLAYNLIFNKRQHYKNKIYLTKEAI